MNNKILKIGYFTLLTVMLLWLFTSMYFLQRNSKVFDLRYKISTMCIEYNRADIPNKKIKNAMLIYGSLPLYDEMVRSFEPLTIENYIDSTILKELERPYKENFIK